MLPSLPRPPPPPEERRTLATSSAATSPAAASPPLLTSRLTAARAPGSGSLCSPPPVAAAAVIAAGRVASGAGGGGGGGGGGAREEGACGRRRRGAAGRTMRDMVRFLSSLFRFSALSAVLSQPQRELAVIFIVRYEAEEERRRRRVRREREKTLVRERRQRDWIVTSLFALVFPRVSHSHRKKEALKQLAHPAKRRGALVLRPLPLCSRDGDARRYCFPAAEAAGERERVSCRR